jgi:hypothetical protein
MANLHSYPLAIPRETERRTGSGLRRTQSHPKKELQLRPADDSSAMPREHCPATLPRRKSIDPFPFRLHGGRDGRMFWKRSREHR